jgi:branched-chain amino acid transport system permease protein
LAAEVAGLNVFSVKWLAFVLSAVYSGVAGAVYAHTFSFISPEAFGLIVSINILAMVLIGGSAQIWGVMVGSVIVTGLPEVLRFTREYYMLIYGLGIVLFVIFLPAGISGYLGVRSSGTTEAGREIRSTRLGPLAALLRVRSKDLG